MQRRLLVSSSIGAGYTPRNWSKNQARETDGNRQALCNACEPGKVQILEQQTSCVDCEIGTYQELPGQIKCDECEAGKFQATEGNVLCFPCIREYTF